MLIIHHCDHSTSEHNEALVSVPGTFTVMLGNSSFSLAYSGLPWPVVEVVSMYEHLNIYYACIWARYLTSIICHLSSGVHYRVSCIFQLLPSFRQWVQSAVTFVHNAFSWKHRTDKSQAIMKSTAKISSTVLLFILTNKMRSVLMKIYRNGMAEWMTA